MKKLLLVSALAAAAALSAAAQKGDPAAVQLQSAINKEVVEGDLRGAIEQYRKLAQSPNRAVAAKALVRMGQCYEKLGDAEARKAYESVVRRYADQTDAATEARARLAALGQPGGPTPPSGMLARRVWEGPDVDVGGSPSADGQHLTYVDWNAGDLAVRDLATGQKRYLTRQGYAGFPFSSVISPDGRQVAYNWFLKGAVDLRLLPLDATPESTKPVILHQSAETAFIVPADWSPDGTHILSVLNKKDGTSQLVLVPATPGPIRVLKTVGPNAPATARFSPDGRYIVYDFKPKQTLLQRDIVLLAADGSRETVLVEHPAHDRNPFWTPDGTRVVFASDRTGSLGLWAIRVSDGKAVGNPELVKPDIGRIVPMGFTRKGAFYYGLRAGANDIYMATLDLVTGKAVAPPAVMSQRYEAMNSAPAWSPDGEHLVYVSYRGPITQGPGSGVIVVRSMKTGEERELVPRITGFYQQLRWSPDGRSFLAQGQGPQGGLLYRIDAQTGEVAQIGQPVSMTIRQWNWTPDGKGIFHLANDPKLQQRLVSRNLETGQETEICRVGATSRNNGLAVSPDGKRLVFTVSDAATRSTALMIVAASGGEPRELLRVKEPESILASLAWTPDGRGVLLVKREDPGVQKVPALWHIPAEGGEARKLELAMFNLRGMALHPDGRRIVFAGGENKWEVWVLEDFLPNSPAAATAAKPNRK